MSHFKLFQGETDDLAVGFSQNLDSGDGLTTPISVTIHEHSADTEVTSGLTVSGEGVNTSAVVDSDGTTHAIGEAIQFRLALTTLADGKYRVRVEAATDNGQSKVEVVPLRVSDPADPS